jgi:AraC family transcriptional regulator
LQHQHTLPGEKLQLPGLPAGENPDGFRAHIREQAARRVAYLRVSRPFEPGRVTDAAKRLVAWAIQHGCAEQQWLGYMWEDPEIVELDKCFYHVAVEVPIDFQTSDQFVNLMDFPALRLAEVEVNGSLDVEQRALDWLYRTWLPRSRYVPDHQPCFEAWNGLPFAHGDSHFELWVQLAIVLA